LFDTLTGRWQMKAALRICRRARLFVDRADEILNAVFICRSEPGQQNVQRPRDFVVGAD